VEEASLLVIGIHQMGKNMTMSSILISLVEQMWKGAAFGEEGHFGQEVFVISQK
jgi:hypothetical protein